MATSVPGNARRFQSGWPSQVEKLAGTATATRMVSLAERGKLAADRVTPSGRRNFARLSSFRDAHLDERCVIIGNGPSLNRTDMTLLRDEVTFGMNRLYLMYEELGFPATYHVAVDKLVVRQFADELRRVPSPLFAMATSREDLGSDGDISYLQQRIGARFSTDLRRGVGVAGTVTYVAMQIAYHMGFREVILIGVDHNDPSARNAPAVDTRSEPPAQSHFHPDYYPKGTRLLGMNLQSAESGYSRARDAFERRGAKIVDATVGGNLRVFPKVRLEEVLA